jgi:formylglycine-generating enzyme required for sulfatase activity
MADQPQQTLCDLVQIFGAEVSTDPQRCEALLRDRLPRGFKQEVDALIRGARAGVPSALCRPTGGLPLSVVIVQQATKLQDSSGLDPSLAKWSVMTWAAALGIKLPVACPPMQTTSAAVAMALGPVSSSGFDLAKRLRHQQARQQQEHDEARLIIAEARRLLAEDQDVLGVEQILRRLPEHLSDHDLLAEVRQKRDELLKQQTQQERKSLIKQANQHIAEAKRISEFEHDYARAVHFLEMIPRHLSEGDPRLAAFVASMYRKRDRILELERYIVAEGHADRFDFLRPCVAEFLLLQPQRNDMRELLAALPKVAADGHSGHCICNDCLSRLALPFTGVQAKTAQVAWAMLLAKQLVEKNQLGMKLVLIPPGQFTMGSPATEQDRSDNETQVSVTLTRAFWLSKTQVTQGQWFQVMGTKPWHGEKHVKQGINYAASCLSWHSAQEFAQKLSQREGVTYRLPTEAEWEWSCRAGTSSRWSFGEKDEDLNRYGWYGGFGGGNTKAEPYPHQVGQKRANPFGLYDLHGNVFEWCADVYADTLPGGTDPYVTTGRNFRVLRGGSWNDVFSSSRSAFRGWSSPDFRGINGGFRILRTQQPVLL